MPPEETGGGVGAETFAVAATADEAEAFRAAVGAPGAGDVLPATFPMRWLAGPAVRAMLTAAVPGSGVVPVHEGQDFTYERPLRVGVPYRMRLLARREAEPPRLVVDGRIEDSDGAPHAGLQMTLRLVALEEPR